MYTPRRCSHDLPRTGRASLRSAARHEQRPERCCRSLKKYTMVSSSIDVAGEINQSDLFAGECLCTVVALGFDAQAIGAGPR